MPVRAFSWIVVVVLLAGLAAPEKRSDGTAAAAKPSPVADAAASPTPASDARDVLARLHHANLFGTEEARLALKNARDAQVHAFAKTLIADHAAADRMLSEYAKSHALDVGDAALDERTEQETLARLRTLKGSDFDRALVRTIYEDHVKAVDTLVATREGLADQKLRNVLTRIKPKLDQHRNTARSLLRRLETAER